VGTSLVNSGSGIFRSFLLTWWLGSYKSFSFNYFLFDSLIQTEKRGCPMSIFLLVTVWGSWAIFRARWDGTNNKHKAYAVSYYTATFLGEFFNVRIFLTRGKSLQITHHCLLGGLGSLPPLLPNLPPRNTTTSLPHFLTPFLCITTT